MQKIRVDSHIDYQIYMKLLAYMVQNGCKNASQGVNKILSDHFTESDAQKTTADRLNKVIQQQQTKIDNLEFELKTKAKVVE